tara:strand:- start:70 stop:1449 length:1380 start_codon:yes stop_codon:yes gene_type:complete
MSKTAPITIPHNFKPRDYQLKVFQAMDGIKDDPSTKKRRAILRWHRRAGKDKCCWCYLIKEAAQVPGNYFYVFPTKTMARQALWENVDSNGFKLLNHLPSQFIKRLSNQEMLIELNNGSTIRVLGYDKDPDSIRGIACKGAVFSEFAFSDPESYKTMIPALRESRGWAIFNSTPNGRNHFYDLWQNVRESDNWYASQLQTYWPDKDNYSGLVPKADFPMIIDEEGLTDEDVEREYGVSFSTGMKGSFYADHIERAYSDGRITEFVYDDMAKVDTFWDLGIDDSTAVWFRQKIGNKIIFIDYYEESGKDLKHYVKILESKGYEYGTHYLPHDAGHRSLQTGSTTADIFQDLCRAAKISDDVWVLGKTRVQDGISAVRAKFSRYHFDSFKCAAGIKNLELYHRRWDKRRNVFMKEPVHDFSSHSADALRMEAIAEDVVHDHFYKQNDFKVITDYDLFGDDL